MELLIINYEIKETFEQNNFKCKKEKTDWSMYATRGRGTKRTTNLCKVEMSHTVILEICDQETETVSLLFICTWAARPSQRLPLHTRRSSRTTSWYSLGPAEHSKDRWMRHSDGLSSRSLTYSGVNTRDPKLCVKLSLLVTRGQSKPRRTEHHGTWGPHRAGRLFTPEPLNSETHIRRVCLHVGE